MKVLTALLLMTTAVMAQEVPSEEYKIRVLKEAYRFNGDSMVRFGSIDMTGMLDKTDDVKVIRTIPIVPTPIPAPVSTPKADKLAVAVAPEPETDTCKRHHMRKVVTGNSWRCRRR